MSNKDIFDYNRFLKPICRVLTNHRHRKLIGWQESFSVNKNPKYYDFYYKCKICGYVYFNNKPSADDLEHIKEYDKEEKVKHD